jgi:hypothetical protein
MAERTAPDRSRRRAVAAVVAVAVLQIVTAVVTTVIWIFRTMFAGNACSPACDWVGADRAGMVYATFVVASFAITAVAMLIAWRREKDLAWVPLIGVAVTVGGLILSLWLFDQAMS